MIRCGRGAPARCSSSSTPRSGRRTTRNRRSPLPPTCWSSMRRSTSRRCTPRTPRSSWCRSRRSASMARGPVARPRSSRSKRGAAPLGVAVCPRSRRSPPVAASASGSPGASPQSRHSPRCATPGGRGAALTSTSPCSTAWRSRWSRIRPCTPRCRAGRRKSGRHEWWRSRRSSRPPTAMSSSPRTARSSTTTSSCRSAAPTCWRTSRSSRNARLVGYAATSSKPWCTSTRLRDPQRRSSKTRSFSAFRAHRSTMARRCPRSTTSSSAACMCHRRPAASCSRASRT